MFILESDGLINREVYEAQQTCKYMTKTAKEPVLLQWRNHLSFHGNSAVNIIDGF
jgi:DNA-binding HxlR family transcriptional regulator